jgi:hypothetical protein
VQIGSVEQDLTARISIDQAQCQTRQGRFARSALTDQGHAFATVHCQRHIVDCTEWRSAVPHEGLA